MISCNEYNGHTICISVHCLSEKEYLYEIEKQVGKLINCIVTGIILCLSCNVKTAKSNIFKSKLQKQSSFQSYSATASYRSLYINHIPGDCIQAKQICIPLLYMQNKCYDCWKNIKHFDICVPIICLPKLVIK